MTTIAICGDPVVCQALTLLLRGSGYKARFLPTMSLWEDTRALKDVRLLVLAPTPKLSTEDRDALLVLLKERPETTKVPILELVTPFEERREEETWDERWYMVPWPCGIEELEQCIEAALPRHSAN